MSDFNGNMYLVRSMRPTEPYTSDILQSTAVVPDSHVAMLILETQFFSRNNIFGVYTNTICSIKMLCNKLEMSVLGL